MNLSELSDAQLQALLAQKTDPNVQAINTIESGGKGMTATPVNPVSKASGNMQTMKTTAGDPGYGVKPSNGTPVDNSRLGTEYYQTLKDKYQDPVKAAVAYNWGPGNADKWIANGAKLGDLPDETLDYVNKFVNHPARVAAKAQAQPQQQALPQGATEINPQIVEEPAQQPAPASQPSAGGVPEYTTGGRLQQGIMDFFGGAGRAVVTGINKLSPSKANEELLAKTDALTKQRNEEFAAKRAAAGADPNSTDWVRMGGQMVPSFLIPGGAATTGGRMLEGIAQGALGSAAMTQPGEDYAKNMTTGGIVGGGVAGIAGAAGRVIAGARPRPTADALMQQGVTPTPGQYLGGVIGRVEEKAESVPLFGDAVISARRGAVGDMNRAIYKDVLEPVGGTAPKEIGRDAVADVHRQLTQKYDQLLPKLNFVPDAQFSTDMQSIYQQASRHLEPDQLAKFDTILDDSLYGSVSRARGNVTGQELKDIETKLTQKIDRYTGTKDVGNDDMADALKTVRDTFRGALSRQNGSYAGELQAVNQAWSRYAVLRDAASRVTNPDMPIKPSQFQAAVKAASGNSPAGKAAFGEGRAKGQSLGDAGMSVLSDRYPNSGTAGRMMTGGVLAGGLGAVNPAALGGLGVLGGMYATDIGRKALLAAVARRPELARQLGAGVQALGPNLGGALAGQKVRDFNK